MNEVAAITSRPPEDACGDNPVDGDVKGVQALQKWPRSRPGQVSSVPPEQPQGPAFIQHSRSAVIDTLNRVTIGPSARDLTSMAGLRCGRFGPSASSLNA